MFVVVQKGPLDLLLKSRPSPRLVVTVADEPVLVAKLNKRTGDIEFFQFLKRRWQSRSIERVGNDFRALILLAKLFKAHL
jgi:hypothetical protein